MPLHQPRQIGPTQPTRWSARCCSYLNGIATFFKRQATLPFDTVFGFFCIYSGLVGLFGIGIINDIFRRVLGPGVADVFNIAYLLAGSGLYFGIGLNKRQVEGVGLIIIMMSLVLRSIATFYYAGLNDLVVNSYVNNTAFTVACAVKLYRLFKRQILIVSQDVKLER